MASVCKILRSHVQCSPDTVMKIFANCMSFGCSGGNKKGGKGSDEKSVIFHPFPICTNPDCKCCSPTYDSRKYGHCLPGNTTRICFDPIPNVPTNIFRCTDGESLGPGGYANKSSYYQNPEYFSYQHMSYYDLHLVMRANRLPSPCTQRKP